MVLTNGDLAKLVETNDEWIATRTGTPRQCCGRVRQCTAHVPDGQRVRRLAGIRERRILSDKETLTQLAADAARQARTASGGA